MSNRKQLILILGGARSGKSNFAQVLAEKMGRQVTFLATAQAGDEEMRRRIEAHRRARPAHWRTIEAPRRVAATLEAEAGRAEVVLLDCMALLIANLLLEGGEDATEEEACSRATAEVAALLKAFERGAANLIVVSNEVGLGVVPPYPLGRVYRDLLGRVNQTLAAAADQVYWLMAGLPVEIKASGLAGAASLPTERKDDVQT